MEFPGVVIVLLVVCLAVTPVAATSEGHEPAPAVETIDSVQESFDRNEVRLTVYENRSARWTFHYERTLSNETERENFEAFAEEFNSTETQLYDGFRRDSTALVADGANFTGREMESTSFSRRAEVTSSLGNEIGVVEMSFTWTGFGFQEGERVIVGDVFEGGLYLGQQQSLVVTPGPNLRFDSVEPAGTQSNSSSLPDSDSVTWQGEREFTDERPRVVFAPAGSDAGGAGGQTDGGGDTGGTAVTTPQSSGWLPWLAGGVLLVGVAAVAWYLRHQSTDESPGVTDDGEGGPTTDATSQSRPSVSDEELLTDEDRVIRMLDRSGGRMKQVNIVEETGWSKSKVSMLLSDMEEEGLISKLRVGRENVISLKGHEPEAAGSPFDDE
ncbi:IclR helix-turn-helix domain-containing protein [Halogranum amylolyticum]|uniref:IclR helix-turn-helix domain-containing protein n=1 Tax=Halogranum amylolyticum TaxID=660520 RepID=A0A1H8WE31_9EURY|nr:helix-turn-helix domain-containing protein [Halogranum amylolyticum]SEP25924.1 IclR helix-turn-helix domain-containing protein [Halogranum amylolyticum]